MPFDFSSYKVVNSETSSDAKFDGFVQAVEDALNGIGALAVSPSQITGYPSDGTKFLGGTGVWVSPSIAGQVSSAGALVAGAGFTPSRSGAGRYTITWSSAFSARPYVIAVVLSNGFYPIVGTPSVTQVNISTNTISGDAAGDCAFMFIAVRA